MGEFFVKHAKKKKSLFWKEFESIFKLPQSPQKICIYGKVFFFSTLKKIAKFFSKGMGEFFVKHAKKKKSLFWKEFESIFKLPQSPPKICIYGQVVLFSTLQKIAQFFSKGMGEFFVKHAKKKKSLFWKEFESIFKLPQSPPKICIYGQVVLFSTLQKIAQFFSKGMG